MEGVALKNLLIMSLFILLSFGCQKEEVVENTPLYSSTPPLIKKAVYLFGVHPLHNPTHLFKVYQPLVDYVNEHLDDSQLRLETSPDYSTFDKKLFSGHFHFALPYPYQTAQSKEYHYRVFGKMGNDENFKGIILVRKDSGIKSVKDLKGKTVSYPAPNALAATMLPQWYLYKHGIDINKDIINSYVGSHESSIMNVYLGKSAAGATLLRSWFAFIKERPEIAKELVVRWETFSLPNIGLVVREDMPKALVQKVGNIIFSLQKSEEGRKILDAMELSKYEPADDSTYDSVRKFLKDFESEVRPIRLSHE